MKNPMQAVAENKMKMHKEKNPKQAFTVKLIMQKMEEDPDEDEDEDDDLDPDDEDDEEGEEESY